MDEDGVPVGVGAGAFGRRIDDDLADAYPHRAEGEGVLLEQVPGDARRILDLGWLEMALLVGVKPVRS